MKFIIHNDSGKFAEIEMPMSPLCRWDGDDGKKHSGHVSRFRKVVDQ